MQSEMPLVDLTLVRNGPLVGATAEGRSRQRLLVGKLSSSESLRTGFALIPWQRLVTLPLSHSRVQVNGIGMLRLERPPRLH